MGSPETENIVIVTFVMTVIEGDQLHGPTARLQMSPDIGHFRFCKVVKY
ncbi:MAG: hypothetical protein GWN58_54010 [Anaerolineae bacterium]|nr:hypothetical protein [Anaerolineae bacterium]